MAAYCSITSLMLLVFLASLLYQANVVEVVKIAICVIFVSYYILTSIIIVQNVYVVSTFELQSARVSKIISLFSANLASSITF